MNTQQLKELAKLADSEVTWILLPKDLANEGWCTEVVNYISVVSPSTITALVDRIEAAEREREELRAWRDTLQRAVDNLDAERDVLRAEIARRDAAAGEPAFYIAASDVDNLKRSHVVEAAISKVIRFDEIPAYTAAPPALLPPEKPVNTDLSRTDIMKNIAYNQALNDVKALGAQPQKPVVLPCRYDIEEMSGDPWQSYRCIEPDEDGEYMRRDEVLTALDAAGVPYEVKP